MGFTPGEVDDCSIWQFLACRDGWVRANTVEKTRPPTPEQHDAMIAKWT
jgi:hypothetical protein